LPEAGRHAPILIAASWQALGRALNEGPDTRICNCTIVVLFAGFYVEANLNHIVRVLKLRNRFRAFIGGNRHPGLQDKLAWFYNEFASPRPATDLQSARRQGINRKIRRRFPGFAALYRFRNDISHGVVNADGRSVPKAQHLRQCAKDVVSELFEILEHRGHHVRRATDYWRAIQ
jgi:hypothetical protein